MNTCKTCKHWIGHLLKGENRAAECDGVDRNEKERKANGTTMELFVYADDDSNLTAKLITGENFGCLHHEQKP